MTKLTLSASGIGTFTACPMKFKYHYIDRIERIDQEDDDNLLIGHSFHHLLETELKDNLDDVPLDEKTKIMIEASATYYYNKYNKKYPDTIQEFKLDTELEGHKYVGFIDLVILDDEEGDTLLDYKFLSSLTFADGYAHGTQAKLYPILYELQTGRKVKAMQFICICKPTIRVKKTEELSEYFERVKQWYEDQERIRFVDVEVSETMKEEMLDELYYLQHMIDNSIYYKNHGNCSSYNKECPFVKLCRREEDAELWYRKRGGER